MPYFPSLMGTLSGGLDERSPDQITDDVLGGNLASTSQMFAQGQAQAMEPPIKIKSETTDSGGLEHTLTMSDQTLQNVMGKMSYLEQALAAMTQEAGRLQAREMRTRQNPLLNVLTQVAGQLAAGDKRLPPVVSALGRASLALNPTPDELAGRRIGLQAEIGRTGLAAAQFGMEQMRERRLQERTTAEIEQKKQDDRTRLFREVGNAAQKGELTDAAIVSQMFQDAGTPKAKADTQAAALVAISQEKRRLAAEAEAAKDERERVAIESRDRNADKRLAVMLSGMGVKQQEKAEQDRAIEEVAQALAPMNKESLNAMNQISGMFGGSRLKIFARARELNPHFNTAQLNRMMDTEKSFTVGKDGQSIQSFDTFLQHAGEVKSTIQNLKLTRSPWLNTPLNKLRARAAGDPTIQRYIVSLEPVKKEFESFLLNQRALYADDRVIAEKMLNDSLSPAQIDAVLNQMGKTARDRFKAMNQRYKRVMGNDIEDSFSPAAHDAAAKIGLDLPVAAPGGTGDPVEDVLRKYAKPK